MSVTPRGQVRRRRAPHPVTAPIVRTHDRETTGSDVPSRRTARRPAACAKCGAVAIVDWLAGYRDGKPVRNQLCLSCAASSPELLRPIAPSRHMRLDTALMLAGAFLAVLGAVHDFLPRAAGGFGWNQLIGVTGGAIILLLGLLTRVDFLAAGGLVVLGVSGAADLLLLHGSAGIGWKQETLILCGLLMLLGGIRLRRLHRGAPSASTADLSSTLAPAPRAAGHSGAELVAS